MWLDTLAVVDSDGLIFVTASWIDVGMLTDVDANAFAAGMAALKFIVPTPLIDSAPFC